MMNGSQDIKMEKIENQIIIFFFADQGTPSGLELTPIINHLEVKILLVHETCGETVTNYQISSTGLYSGHHQSVLVSCL